MTIEFVGLPGVGKSFVCDQLARYLENKSGTELEISPTIDRELGFASKVAKIARATFFLIRHPIVVTRVVNWISHTDQESLYASATKIINLLSELDSADRNHGLMAKDQGVMQAVWSLMLRSRREVDWGELLELLRAWLPAVVIHVIVDRDENIRRLTAREAGHSHFDRLAPEALEAELDRGEDLLKVLFEEWRGHGLPGREYCFTNEADTDLERAFSPFMNLLVQSG